MGLNQYAYTESKRKRIAQLVTGAPRRLFLSWQAQQGRDLEREVYRALQGTRLDAMRLCRDRAAGVAVQKRARESDPKPQTPTSTPHIIYHKPSTRNRAAGVAVRALAQRGQTMGMQFDFYNLGCWVEPLGTLAVQSNTVKDIVRPL